MPSVVIGITVGRQICFPGSGSTTGRKEVRAYEHTNEVQARRVAQNHAGKQEGKGAFVSGCPDFGEKCLPS